VQRESSRMSCEATTPYSARNALTGSTRVARRAGM
jgi:hypothetical protein